MLFFFIIIGFFFFFCLHGCALLLTINVMILDFSLTKNIYDHMAWLGSYFFSFECSFIYLISMQY